MDRAGTRGFRCGRSPWRALGWTALSLLAVAFAGPADATSLSLSDRSSDDTPPSQLSATVDFDVVGTTLTLSVTNQTANPIFQISEILFNSSDAVADLTFSDGPGPCPAAGCQWDLFASGVRTTGGGMGRFDWALISNDLDGDGLIAPGATASFELEISGTGPFDASDFAAEFSSIPPGMTRALVALKFVRCSGAACVENDDSAFGAAIPEPATAALVLWGLAGVAALGRRTAGA